MPTYIGVRHFGKIIVIDKKTGLPTGQILDNDPSNPHYIPDGDDSGLCGSYTTVWVGIDSTCISDPDTGNTGYLSYSTLQEVRTDTGIPTGIEKPNVEGEIDYIAPVYDTNTCPLRQKGWRGKESSATCLLDTFGQQTGYKAYSIIERYWIDNNTATGEEKNNTPGEIDYIAPVYDTNTCPLIRFTAWRAKENTSYCLQGPVDPPQNVPITFNIPYTRDPVVPNLLVFYKNGEQVGVYNYNSTGVITGFVEGDLLTVAESSYINSTPWAPNSKANLSITVNGTVIYNNDVSVQSLELQSYSFTIPIGTTSINVVSTGSSTATGYLTKGLNVNQIYNDGETNIRIDDSGEFALSTSVDYGTHIYDFNTKNNGVTVLTFTLQNLKNTNINYRIEGISSYVKTGTITANSSVVISDVPKGGVTIIYS